MGSYCWKTVLSNLWVTFELVTVFQTIVSLAFPRWLHCVSFQSPSYQCAKEQSSLSLTERGKIQS